MPRTSSIPAGSLGADVTIETWLIPANPWHIRIHRIETPRPLHSAEGGFAIPRADFNRDQNETATGRAVWFGASDTSAIVDLTEGATRAGHAQLTIANTNLIHARTLVPQLRGTIAPGRTIFMTAVCALPKSEGEAFLANVPAAPDLAELERLFQRFGRRVAAFDIG